MGLVYAVIYSGYVIVLYLIRGTAPFEANDTNLGATIAFYFMAGISAGAVFGLFLPLTKKWWGAMIVGAIAGIPIIYSFRALDQPPSDPFFTASNLGFAATFGSCLGLVVWYVFWHQGE